MTFDDLKNTWTALGEADPLWAILTNEESEGGGWDLDAFFASGEAEISSVMAEVDSLGLAFEPGRALDFGCGVGRLTRALGARFGEAHGVDIAPTMLDLAPSPQRGTPESGVPPQPTTGPRAVPERPLRLRVLPNRAAAHGSGVRHALHRGVRPRRSAGRARRVPDPVASGRRRRGRRGPPATVRRLPLPKSSCRRRCRSWSPGTRTESTCTSPTPAARPGPVSIDPGPTPTCRSATIWLDPGDNVVQMDDGRAALPVRLRTGRARRGAVDGARTRCSRLVPARDRPGGGARRLVPRQGKHPVRGPRHGRRSKPPPAWKRLRSEWRAWRAACGPRRRSPAVEPVPTKPRFEMHGTAPSRSSQPSRRLAGGSARCRWTGPRRGTGRATSTSSRSEHDLGSWRRDEDGIGTQVPVRGR